MLGGSEFVQDLEQKEELRGKIKGTLPLMELVDRVAHFFDLAPDNIRRPRKDRFFAQVRGVVCYLAIRELGHRGLETGKELCLRPAGVSIAVRRGEAFLTEKPGLKEKITQL
jgi:chromosomal replication initiation ATPase DnaA